MNKNKIKASKILLFLVASLFLITFIFAQDETPEYNVCCEKTENGAWCQNTLEENCLNSVDPETGKPYRKTPTSCEATSFCKLGCCIDTEEGLCMENTPLRVCEENKGTWVDDSQCIVPQCNLGCCLIGDQASFVTLTRCKRLSNIYGLETNFRNDILNEKSCIMLAYRQDRGACVYEVDGERTCKIMTRGECLESTKEKSENQTSETEFFKNYLCSADDLATNCGPTKETICVEGKFEVYFKDSCGNPANIYDANKIYSKDPSYWQKIVQKQESCGYGKPNTNSKTCGNCEYLLGSICKEGEAAYGDHICHDINCHNTENGNDYRNGESWCVYQGETGNGADPVGSRHFRHVCVHGEETIEPCADFRNEVCISEEFGSAYGNFQEAACRVNRWSDCIDQIERYDCENKDLRDCYWMTGAHYEAAGEGKIGESSDEGDDEFFDDVFNKEEDYARYVKENSEGILAGGGICLPNVPPGFEFWNSEGKAKSICSLGNSKQVVIFEEDIFGSKSCVENCEVLEQNWVNNMNKLCISLGDCGNHVNFIGRYTDKGVYVKDNGKKRLGEEPSEEDEEEEDVEWEEFE
ncbi:hypothetical protein GF386_00185 [Candidatus Pacearchaeota archaeon]|nr:hypothetical protein [Candidatus Pacearchaeota archaeon]MBD3282700.1 hypothetical protein [Candidatus Pacearchaeota archaeon]